MNSLVIGFAREVILYTAPYRTDPTCWIGSHATRKSDRGQAHEPPRQFRLGIWQSLKGALQGPALARRLPGAGCAAAREGHSRLVSIGTIGISATRKTFGESHTMHGV